jgi:hypothetical protein
MLSPGQWHKHVPKDLIANLQFRVHILEDSATDRALQHGLREMCRQDILFFINCFVWQINPDHVGDEVGPFISWDFQDRAILDTMNQLLSGGGRRDALWEKSREMGATWMALIIVTWLTLFHPHKRVLLISHSEEAVTKAGDDGTLFAKIDFILHRLPDWLIGGKVQRRKKGFRMPSGSNISAAASTERSGVGDRCSLVVLDEFSKQRDAYLILGQTADTGPRLFIGTHYEASGTYFDLTQRADLWKIVIHWSQHPERKPGLYQWNPTTQRVDVLDKQFRYSPSFEFVVDGKPTGGAFPGLRSPWYDAECVRRKDSRLVAMNLDIDPAGSQSQVFDPLTINILKQTYCRRPDWYGEVEYDAELGVPRDRPLVAVDAGRLHCWFVPNMHGSPPLGRYVIGVDPSTGSGATPSCVEVVNVETGEQAAEYANPFLDEKSLAPLVVALCRVFAEPNGTPAQLIWETPGPGLVFGRKVVDLGFYHIYYRSEEHKAFVTSKKEIPGWQQSPSGKRLVLKELGEAMRTKELLIYSEAVLAECLKFKYDPAGNPVHGGEFSGNDPSGARVNHGDRVMAMALARWLAKGHGRKIEVITPPKPGIGSLAGRRVFDEMRAREVEAWA